MVFVMFRRLFVAAGVACFISFSVCGQRQITGKLIDVETKKPVKEALVKVEGKDIETRSNFLGFFQLTVDSLDQLLIDIEGYELARVSIPQTNSFQVALTKSAPPIFLVVEQSATFPGGLPAFYDYVSKNLRFPRNARGVNGKVFIEFVIDTTGRIPKDDVKVLKGLHPALDDEAVRVVRGAPAWYPGRQKGKPVRQRMVLPIMFETDGPTTTYNDFYSFIAKNIRYPYEARKLGIEGVVLLSFDTDNLGRILRVVMLQNIGGGCGEETNRVLLNVPSELVVSLCKETNSQKFIIPVAFGLQKPFEARESPEVSEGFILKPVHVTAMNVTRERASQPFKPGTITVRPLSLRADNLENALEKPGAIRQLSLTSRGYNTFPMDILKLKKLEFLDLERNLLNELPAEIGSLTQLEELYLVENNIQSLPATLRDLTKLRVLGLASNRFTSFPEEITALEKLEALDLSYNKLTALPSSIGNLKNLRVLVVKNNEIKKIPPELFKLKKLEMLILTGNPIGEKDIELLKQSFKSAQIEF